MPPAGPSLTVSFLVDIFITPPPPATKLGGVYWNRPVRLSVDARARLGKIISDA